MFGRKKSQDKKKVVQEKPKSKYRAIQVLPCERACEAAKMISSKVFLIKELSNLPLESCQRINECTCMFKHYDDRRCDEERRSDSIILQNIFSGEDHRVKKKRGRRNDD